MSFMKLFCQIPLILNCDTKTMGVNIDKNEFYEIILSNSAHPENMNKKG